MKSPLILRRVSGNSMKPSLKTGDIIMVKRRFKINRGNVIIIKLTDREIVKRVADVKKDKVYVLGDNPSESTDSRSLGWLSKNQVVGKIVWPNSN